MAMAETQVANETEDGTIKYEEAEAEDERVDGDSADRKEVGRTKEVERDDGHNTNDGGNEEVADFPAARLPSEDVFRIETERGEDNNPNWDEEDNL